MSDLPAERLAFDEPAFSFAGADCLCSIILKHSKKQRQTQDSQNIIVVVHSEVAGVKFYLLFYLRFIARRG